MICDRWIDGQTDGHAKTKMPHAITMGHIKHPAQSSEDLYCVLIFSGQKPMNRKQIEGCDMNMQMYSQT